MKEWRLKKGFDRRVKSGHPWVFSNEINGNLKSILPGEPVRISDDRGIFCGYGYGNPHSLIAARVMSFVESEVDSVSIDSVLNRLKSAWMRRFRLGFVDTFRVCFSEADFLPGLIVDRYLKIDEDGTKQQVFSFQVLTMGMEKLLGIDQKQFEKVNQLFKNIVDWSIKGGFSEVTWEKSFIVLRNDSRVRSLEGLGVEEPTVIWPQATDPAKLVEVNKIVSDSKIVIGDIQLSCDILNGQKTGLFLDQRRNLELVSKFFNARKHNETVRILDLCCYVGNWSVNLIKNLKGAKSEVWLVDASETALKFAEKNCKQAGVEVKCINSDVLKLEGKIPTNYFDIVIADPPAFIKNKKDYHQGRHAYMKLNQAAFEWAKSNGIVVSCSCSGLLTEEDFLEDINKASRRAKVNAFTLSKGVQSEDHLTLPSFEDGRYLKMYCHLIEK